MDTKIREIGITQSNIRKMEGLVRANAKLVRGHEAPEGIMAHLEAVGRLCHASGDKAGPGTADAFVRMIIRLGHESILEHWSVTALVTCDRATSHQWVRHRLGSYAQLSQRYVNHSDCKFVDPEFRSKATGQRYAATELGEASAPEDVMVMYRNYYSGCLQALERYNAIRQAGAAPEDARAILPNGAATTFYCTYNLRQWRHFFVERCNAAAQHNIRRIALELLLDFNRILPACFGDLVQKFAAVDC